MKKGKKKAVKDGAGGDESGSDYTDTSGVKESDSESEVEIPNDKVHDLSSTASHANHYLHSSLPICFHQKLFPKAHHAPRSHHKRSRRA